MLETNTVVLGKLHTTVVYNLYIMCSLKISFIKSATASRSASARPNLRLLKFFFIPSLMEQAEADRLAACCFSIHGKDEFRTIKPVSCLNC